VKPKRPAGPPMTLGNVRELGVQRLIASWLNDACRHVALIDVSGYPADTEVPWFRSRVVCAKWPLDLLRSATSLSQRNSAECTQPAFAR
jgi:hypothetical protein